MALGNLQFAAFLSYSRQDQRLASWLVRSLEGLRLPPQTLADLKARQAPFLATRPIFRDEHDMPVGGAISERLAEVLDGSASMIVLCTPASARSAWVNEEIERFASRQPGRRIIAVMAEGDPDAHESYPPGLLRLGKPLAADLRVSRERRQAVVKIAAAILGVDVDQLVGRFSKHRAEQRRWIAAGAGAAAAVVVGLGLTAVLLNDRANRADELARANIERLLTDTRREMDAVGLLAAKAAVHSAAQAYFDGKAGRRLNSKDLLLKAEWLRQEGVDAAKRGEAEQALAYRQEAYAATTELLRRSPNNPEHLFSHAQSAFWVGEYYYQRGRMGEARGPWETYTTTAEQLLTAAPDYPGAALEVHYARVNIGMLALEEKRDPRAAAAAFAAALDVLDSNAENLDARLNLSRGHLQYVEALAQFAPASEVLAAAQTWAPLLHQLEAFREASDEVEFHLANSWGKILLIEEGAGLAREPDIQARLLRGPERDPDNITSLTFAVELSLKTDGAPDCKTLPLPTQVNAARSAELRLAKECLPAMPRQEQVVRCSGFADALRAQPDRLELEKAWALLLTACSKAAVETRNADFSRSLEDAVSRRFFNRRFEGLRLSTQFSLADFQTADGNAWIQGLRTSLDKRGWRTRGKD